jgi:zinc D-Ala-D-Ala dipeptidase
MNKRVLRTLLIVLLFLACSHGGTVIPPNEYGLPVVSDRRLYHRLVEADPRQVLVPLTQADPNIRLDIRYATTDNFMKARLYPEPQAWARCEVALALARVQSSLEPRGIGLKVFDAYRPYAVTVAMWESIRDPDYVADPAQGSRHNRGAAIDVTLVDLATGEELPMPTSYDDFTPAASHEASDLSLAALQNRAILRGAMEAEGFEALSSEWWHYDYQGWERFPLMNLPHRVLEPPRAPCPAAD